MGHQRSINTVEGAVTALQTLFWLPLGSVLEAGRRDTLSRVMFTLARLQQQAGGQTLRPGPYALCKVQGQ